MSLNVNIDQLDSLKDDVQGIKDKTTTVYDEVSDLSNTISGNWSSTGSDAFISKYNAFTKNFENYSSTLNTINNYIVNTEDEFLKTQEKVEDTVTEEV